jgi:sigma-B regulation protein RsbU (phosphoserine phosphatase)
MRAATPYSDLSPRDLEPILAVARKLAAPFDLETMLGEVVMAARQVLQAERASVWLYEAATDELVLRFSGELGAVRVPGSAGLVGSCARTRRLINVPDCYADARFDPSLDRQTGYRTRCLLTLPLLGHQDALVGVMQVLNKVSGVFVGEDEALATVLAAQCAVALERARSTEALLEGERMRKELEMARDVQRATLPAQMPAVPGYDVQGTFHPATLTGGDTFDVALFEKGLMVVLADATGHGMGPALSVSQMQAMLRMAFRLGAGLEGAFTHVNNLLAEGLPGDHFITAFIGVLDPLTHRLRFHSAGQGPILLFRAGTGALEAHPPTSFPLGAMPLTTLAVAPTVELGPGDILVLLSDGYLEHRDAEGQEYGQDRVAEVLRENHDKTMEELAAVLLGSVRTFARGAPQEDDMTAVLIKREPPSAARFARRIDALGAIFAFVDAAFLRHGLDASLRGPVELTVEELFTNMVKYSHGGGEVQLSLLPIPGGVEATLIDEGVEPFDPTTAPEVDVQLPLAERKPGKLGIHLVKRLVDSIEYAYRADLRQSRITFRKTLSGPSPTLAGASPGDRDALD